jgi:hypothetical protein
MSPNLSRMILLGLITLLLIAALAVAPAVSHAAPTASPGSYDLSWWTVDGGGTTFSTGSSYNLGGTIGQPDAGTSSGGIYTLAGGFWGGVVSILYRIYLPLVMR